MSTHSTEGPEAALQRSAQIALIACVSMAAIAASYFVILYLLAQ